MEQATMFEALDAPRNVHEAKFMQFHQANPIVYKLWDQFTREALARGVKRVGSALQKTAPHCHTILPQYPLMAPQKLLGNTTPPIVPVYRG